MSQNKTVIQGLEPADASGGFSTNASPNFYTRGTGRPAARGTVVPGMTDNVGGQTPSSGVASAPQQSVQQHPVQSGKPVVGFLYSVSRTAAGEFWPLHIGQNTIGQGPQNDIVLPEGTVSLDHAVLVVRKMKKPEKVIASISDARSTNGTMLNGESLGFSAVECKNGDIITIGDNYELYLILVDAPTLGLAVSENFIAVAVEEPEDDGPFFQDGNQGPVTSGYTRPGDDYNTFGGPQPPTFGGGGGYSGGTVGLDGTPSGGNHGGTIPM